MSRCVRAALLGGAFALTALCGGAAPPSPPVPPAPQAPYAPNLTLALDGAGECTFPMHQQIAGRPWALQRLLLDALWARTKGKGVRVAVIDTGVDRANPQLSAALDPGAGRDFVDPGGDGTRDPVGHGTKVAGIVAARPQEGTGFVGIAPEATIIPVRQHDGRDGGGPAALTTLARAVDHAVDARAQVVNISQDTEAPLTPDSELARAVRRALERQVVIVASAGNGGLNGRGRTTYPAAFPGVLAVAASDRDNERAAFSRPGAFVGVAAPGVDMVSTVPGFGQCVDSGTSFSAPYVAGLAALLRAQHPRWTAQEVVWQIQNTAERSVNGRDDHVGWGVVDPVRAVTQDRGTPRPPVPDRGPPPASAPRAAELRLSETARERQERIGTYALCAGAVLVAVTAGTATVVRDARNHRHPSR
ncbi:type VII secretion-associated serine protease mycosin [Streptomyces sp. NBC_00249]|uniref:type VII secretion-associated serine protease mycosin n=1 Tax=Streptomyces sp. NBC_00249 TaxID=2975690 RepID=UPI002250AEE3|nr:type VII secretion-associated serine protease mycosin [Streptomyces sp. NBC_00249]MCX5194014.1 type VII secretion-associated serine protease mycosin [Streptomyces sp. NBC_00249]